MNITLHYDLWYIVFAPRSRNGCFSTVIHILHVTYVYIYLGVKPSLNVG